MLIISLTILDTLSTVLLAGLHNFAYPNHNPWTLSTVACPYCSFAWVVSASVCVCCCWVQNARHCLQSGYKTDFSSDFTPLARGTLHTLHNASGGYIDAGGQEGCRRQKQNVSFSVGALFAMVFVIATE